VVRSPLGCLVVTVVLVATAAIGACGRSAEPAVACPAPATDCDDLLAQQRAIESAYTAAAVDGDDPAVRAAAGECAVLLSRAALDAGCVEACVELCRLHPCPILDDSGVVDDDGDCVARCGVVVAESAGVDLDRALSRAAQDPGLCSCRGCGAPDDALCTALFDCAAE
jgi:hypothetical protein